MPRASATSTTMACSTFITAPVSVIRTPYGARVRTTKINGSLSWRWAVATAAAPSAVISTRTTTSISTSPTTGWRPITCGSATAKAGQQTRRVTLVRPAATATRSVPAGAISTTTATSIFSPATSRTPASRSHVSCTISAPNKGINSRIKGSAAWPSRNPTPHRRSATTTTTATSTCSSRRYTATTRRGSIGITAIGRSPMSPALRGFRASAQRTRPPGAMSTVTATWTW